MNEDVAVEATVLAAGYGGGGGGEEEGHFFGFVWFAFWVVVCETQGAGCLSGCGGLVEVEYAGGLLLVVLQVSLLGDKVLIVFEMQKSGKMIRTDWVID